MAQPRLTTALDEGLLTLDGPVTVVRPGIEYDLSGLAVDSTRILQGFRPAYEFWAASGYQMVEAPAGECLIVVPRSKAFARHLIANAAARGGRVIVDGQRTDGVDSLFKAVRKRVGDLSSVTKAHGRLFWFKPGKVDFSDWVSEGAVLPEGYVTQPGVFSDGKVDHGSRILAEHLPTKLSGVVADLGAGWGYLTAQLLERAEGVQAVDMIEAETRALDCAAINVRDPRATGIWADVLTWQPERRYDAVVMNPPFHDGRAGDTSLGQKFIAKAAKALGPHGQLWMVANRHLPYEAELNARFARVSEVAGDGAFKVFNASRPKT